MRAACRKNAPEEVQQAVEEEISKLRVLETASSEYNVSRNYLDWLTSMPYGLYNDERFDIAFARQCLDADHYGMQDVKDGILEFIAVGKLNNAVQVRPAARFSVCLVWGWSRGCLCASCLSPCLSGPANPPRPSLLALHPSRSSHQRTQLEWQGSGR